MATPRASTGAGSALYRGDGASPENFNNGRIAQVLTIKDSGMKQATEKVTNMDSDINANGQIFQELIGTVVDPGTYDLTLNWVPADTSQQSLLDCFDNKVHNWQIRGPINIGSSPLTRKFTSRFAATMFESASKDLTVDKAMVLTVKLQVIGQPDDITYNDPVGSN